MKKRTIRKRLLGVIVSIVVAMSILVGVASNLTIHFYMESTISHQLEVIANRTEHIALQKGPELMPKVPDKPPGDNGKPPEGGESTDPVDLRFYFMLDRSLSDSLSVLNADYLLLDLDNKLIESYPYEYFSNYKTYLESVRIEVMDALLGAEKEVRFSYDGQEYLAIIKSVQSQNNFGVGTIVIFSSLAEIKRLQVGINVILLGVLLVSLILAIVVSVISAKRIAKPFGVLNDHLSRLGDRNFGDKLHLPVDDELQSFVDNLNRLSLKLAQYDQSQQAFFQNASHDLRTPLMAIRGYAEGILYDVTEPKEAAKIILEESQRMTQLVEEILYLSKFNHEVYQPEEKVNVTELIEKWVKKYQQIQGNGIILSYNLPEVPLWVRGNDSEWNRLLDNLITNCLNHGKSKVWIVGELIETEKMSLGGETKGSPKLRLEINDDGPGFDEADIPHLFTRFYKGKKGHTGLGLAIAEEIVLKHQGKIWAMNTMEGASFRVTVETI